MLKANECSLPPPFMQKSGVCVNLCETDVKFKQANVKLKGLHVDTPTQ